QIVPVKEPGRPSPGASRPPLPEGEDRGEGDLPDVTRREVVDVVGPVCESGDFFAQDRELPELREGELAAIMSAGAYGFVMASNYNSRPLPAEVLVRGGEAMPIRERQTYEDRVRGRCAA